MQKITKYLIAIGICIAIFCSGFIAGCTNSDRKTGVVELENQRLRESVINYSITVEDLSNERDRVDRRVKSLESEIDNLGEIISGISPQSQSVTDGLGSLYGEISDSRQGVQEVGEGLAELDSEIREIIERAKDS